MGITMLYELFNTGKGVEMISELGESSVEGGITALASDVDGDFLCTSSSSGTVGVWKVKSTKNIKFSFSLREKRK